MNQAPNEIGRVSTVSTVSTLFLSQNTKSSFIERESL